MMKAIAIDDEPVALDILRAHARQVSFLQMEAVFLSATVALAYLKHTPTDLVFVDINMPDMCGLELAAAIKHKVQVIFTTAYAEHAVKGFEVAATDYLLKPINFNRFLQACRLAVERKQQADEVGNALEKALFVKDGHHWVQIMPGEILYVQGQDNYVCIFEKDKRTLTRITLNELERRLPAGKFLRIHKSYIAALSQIEKVETSHVIIKKYKIPLSRSCRERLLNRLFTVS